MAQPPTLDQLHLRLEDARKEYLEAMVQQQKYMADMDYARSVGKQIQTRVDDALYLKMDIEKDIQRTIAGEPSVSQRTSQSESDLGAQEANTQTITAVKPKRRWPF